MPDRQPDQGVTEVQSCRSEEGITVGLVDAVIGIVRVAVNDFSGPTGLEYGECSGGARGPV